MPATSNREAKRDRDGAVGLRYVGDGSAFPDIPAHDLSADAFAAIAQRLVEQAEREAADRLPGNGEEGPPRLTARSLHKLLLDSGLYIEAPITVPAAPEISEG